MTQQKLWNIAGYAIAAGVAGFITYTAGQSLAYKYVDITKTELVKVVIGAVDEVEAEAKKAVSKIKSDTKSSANLLKAEAKQSGRDLEDNTKKTLQNGLAGLLSGKKSLKDIEKDVKAEVKKEESDLKTEVKKQEDSLKVSLKTSFDNEALENKIKAQLLTAMSTTFIRHWDLTVYTFLGLIGVLGSIYMLMKNVVLLLLGLLGKGLVSVAEKKKK